MMEPGEEIDNGDVASLAAQARCGDRSAFDRLARHYRPALLGLAFVRTGRMADAEDLVQEILARAWEKLSALEEPAAFPGWIRAIAAHACTDWYRRKRPAPEPLEMLETTPPLHAAEPGPLEALLARERQRELHEALVALPDANRTALLMHAWGGYSYAEIAAFTGVSASTVLGRIQRARQHLCRLLDETHTTTARPQKPRATAVKERKTMTTYEPATAPALDTMRVQLQFVRQMVLMIDAGVSLMRSLDALRDLPEPYAAAVDAVMGEVENGNSLSRALAQHPDLFSRHLCVLVRAGEVGGVLDETLRRAARLMARELRLVRRSPDGETLLLMLLGPSRPRPEDWQDLSPYPQAVTQYLFFDTFGTLLQSGVPILMAMETAENLLPRRQTEILARNRQEIKEGGARTLGLERLGTIPRFALTMIEVGQAAGTLDIQLMRIAEYFEQEINDADS